MTLDGEQFDPDSSDTIKDQLVTAFEDEFAAGEVNVGDLIDALLDADAEVLADQQQDLRDVYEAAYLSTATGDNLERLTEIIGIARNRAVAATGVQRFGTSTVPSATSVIPTGLTVTTAGSDPVAFDVTSPGVLDFVDDFENGISTWTGDTGSFSTVQKSFARDSYVLKAPATAGAELIHTADVDRGTRFGAFVYLQSNTELALRFARQDASNFYAVVATAGGQLSLVTEDGGSRSTVAATVGASVPTGERLYLDVDWQVDNDITVTLYDSATRDTERVGPITATDDTFASVDGDISIVSKDANNPKFADDVGVSGVSTDITAVNGGEQGNVGARQITQVQDTSQLPSAVTVVENPLPTGDTDYVDTGGDTFRTGRNREPDDELRDRARDATSIGGAGTALAVGTAVEELDGVQSVTVYNNRTDQDNTGSGGLPPHGVEVVAYKGDDQTIAETIFENGSATSNFYGGAFGTKVSVTVSSSVLAQDQTIEFSRPTVVNLDIDVDLAVNDQYVGDEAVKRQLVDEIGGTNPDGSTEPGLDVGEDVFLGVLRDRLIDPTDNGIVDVDFPLIDTDGDGTDDTTTVNGATRIQIASNEVAETNGSDGSITVSTQQI